MSLSSVNVIKAFFTASVGVDTLPFTSTVCADNTEASEPKFHVTVVGTAGLRTIEYRELRVFLSPELKAIPHGNESVHETYEMKTNKHKYDAIRLCDSQVTRHSKNILTLSDVSNIGMQKLINTSYS